MKNMEKRITLCMLGCGFMTLLYESKRNNRDLLDGQKMDGGLLFDKSCVKSSLLLEGRSNGLQALQLENNVSVAFTKLLG